MRGKEKETGGNHLRVIRIQMSCVFHSLFAWTWIKRFTLERWSRSISIRTENLAKPDKFCSWRDRGWCFILPYIVERSRKNARQQGILLCAFYTRRKNIIWQSELGRVSYRNVYLSKFLFFLKVKRWYVLMNYFVLFKSISNITHFFFHLFLLFLNFKS